MLKTIQDLKAEAELEIKTMLSNDPSLRPGKYLWGFATSSSRYALYQCLSSNNFKVNYAILGDSDLGLVIATEQG